MVRARIASGYALYRRCNNVALAPCNAAMCRGYCNSTLSAIAAASGYAFSTVEAIVEGQWQRQARWSGCLIDNEQWDGYCKSHRYKKRRGYDVPTIPIFPFGGVWPQCQQFMEQIKVHRIQACQMQTCLSTNTELLNDLGCSTDECINDFGGGLAANGSAEWEHAVGILGGDCVWCIIR